MNKLFLHDHHKLKTICNFIPSILLPYLHLIYGRVPNGLSSNSYRDVDLVIQICSLEAKESACLAFLLAVSFCKFVTHKLKQGQLVLWPSNKW